MRCRTRSKSWNRYWRNGSEFSWQQHWRWPLLGGNGSSAPNRPDHYRPDSCDEVVVVVVVVAVMMMMLYGRTENGKRVSIDVEE